MTRTQIPLLLALLAFALRLWRIDAQSLRGDEAFDVLFALQPLGEIFYQDRFNQIYPPLYHTLDHFWLVLAGVPELSARFIALWAGVLLVPLTYQLAKRLLDARVAVIAAFLVAIHPFLIWHSQDGRMYTLLAAFSLLATLCAAQVWSRVQPSAGGERTNHFLFLALYILVSAFNVLNHYFAYFSVFAINVVALYLWWWRKWQLKFYAQWFAANALVGVVAAIWAALAWTRIAGHSEPWIAPTSPFEVLTRSLLAYSLGTTIEWAQAWPFLIAFVALTILGIGSWRPFAPRQTGLEVGIMPRATSARGEDLGFVVTILAFVPLVVIYLGSLWRPMYDEKFLIFIVPFYMMLVARGMVVLGAVFRRTPTRGYATTIAAAIVVVGMMLSLFNYHFDPQFAKSPPWREAAQWLLRDARAGDVVVYNFPDPALPYQIGERLPLVLLPAQGPGDPAVAKPLDAASAESELVKLSAQVERIGFVPQPSPNWDADGAVARWLSRFADRDDEAQFGSLKVERYLTPHAYQKIWSPLSAQFADGAWLMAYRVAPLPDHMRLTLYWQAMRPVSKDYTVFAHLLNEAGMLVAQQDNPPVNGTYPTMQWATGTIIVDRYVIITPSDLPRGHYRFEVGMYDANGTRLQVGNDDKIIFDGFLK